MRSPGPSVVDVDAGAGAWDTSSARSVVPALPRGPLQPAESTTSEQKRSRARRWRTPKAPGSIRPSLALAPAPLVAPPSRDGGHAPSSLLGLGRACGAIIRSIQVVSALGTKAGGAR